MTNHLFHLKNEEIQTICENGSLAPSGGNMQPWKVNVRNNKIIIALDPDRLNHMPYFAKLGAVFSLGMFTENMVLTAKALGLDYVLDIHDPQDFTQSMITVTFLKRLETGTNLKDPIYELIRNRGCNRNLGDGRIIDSTIIKLLENRIRASNETCCFWHVHSHKDKLNISKILGRGDAIRMTSPALIEATFNEVRWTQAEVMQTRDGVDLATLELPALTRMGFIAMKKFKFLRYIVPEKVHEQMPSPFVKASSHIGCLTMKGKPTFRNLIIAGQALETIWLSSCEHHLALHPWSVLPFFILQTQHFNTQDFTEKQAQELNRLDDRLRELYGYSDEELPFFIFRLSRAPSPTVKSLRIPWEHFTQRDSSF